MTVFLPPLLLMHRDWQLFDDFLTLYFKNRAGRFFVDRGDYDLTSSGDDSALVPLDVTNWEYVVKPGCAVDMTAVVRRIPQDLNGALHCPSCTHAVQKMTCERNAGNKWYVNAHVLTSFLSLCLP